MRARKTGQRLDGATLTSAGPACICGGRSYREVLAGSYNRLGRHGYAFAIIECKRCNLARTFPVPDPEQYLALADLRGDDDYSVSLAADVRSRVEGTRLLDVGCNTGNVVAAAIRCGFADAVGVDIDSQAIAAGQRMGRPVRDCALSDVVGEWDAIIANHVLEHIAEPHTFLREMHRLLAPHGRAFIFVPNFRGLMPRLMGERWMGWFADQHIWQFSPSSLERLVRDYTELRVVSLTSRGVIEPPSSGLKGHVKAGLAWSARRTRFGDQIELTLAR